MVNIIIIAAQKFGLREMGLGEWEETIFLCLSEVETKTKAGLGVIRRD